MISMRMPVNQTGGPTAVEIIQQSFNPAVAVLGSPDVDIVCSKNRLTFVELLQPFSRLSVEGQIRDPNNSLHAVNNFRLSVRDISWKPASAVLARRLLSDAVSNYNNIENKITITGGSDVIEVNTSTPWYDSWKETLWGCLEWTEHDFTRHYLGTLLVVSSTHPNPMEQFQQLNDQLTQLMANNGINDGPRWFNSMSVRYFVLLHDALEGDAAKAEEIFQSMRTQYGTHGCHLLAINSKPKRVTSSDSVLPAPDPWLRFLPRKNSKTDVSLEAESSSGDAVDNGSNDLPSKITTDVTAADQTSKIPLMDALQDAMQEINLQSILPPSASTLALSMLASDQSTAKTAVNHRSAVEIAVDPLSANSPSSPVQFTIGSNDSDGTLLGLDSKAADAEVHGSCLTADDLDRIQSLINEFCLKALLPHMERQMRFLNEVTSSRKSTSRSILSATKRWFGSARPGSQPTQTTAISYHPESGQLQIRRLGDLAFLLGMYPFAYGAYHTAKKDFEADEAWSHYAGALEMAALSVFFQAGTNAQNRNVPFHYFETALKYYLDTCKMVQWATRCAVIASECLKATNQYSEAAGHLIRLISEDADLRSAVLLEQAALCFLRGAVKPGQNETAKPNALPWVRKYAFHMILAGHRFGKSGQKRHASRAYQLASQVYCGHGWSLAEDHIYYTVGRQCLSNQQIEAACRAFGALLKPDSMQTAAQQTAYLNEFIHVHQLLAKQSREAKALPILPLPVVDSNRIKVLVEARDSVECEPGITEAANVTFDDDEAHHSKWVAMEEKLVLCIAKTLPMIFRPTNVLFTETTDNTCQPQSFCDELISLEVPLSNPLRIPIHLSDIRLMWHFSGDDGELSSLTAAVDNPLVTAYAAPSVILNPSSSNKIILHIKPQAEGSLTIEGIYFTLRPANADPATPGGTIPLMNGRVLFNVQGPRLNTNAKEKQNIIYAPDKRLLIQVGPRMPRLCVSFQSLPDFLLSGEIRPVKVELSSCPPNLPIGKILVATNDPRIVALELPVEKEDDQLVIYRWDPMLKSSKMWIRGAKEGGLIFVDLMFFYNSPTIDAKYRLLRHCCKIVVSSSLGLNAWFQQVPSVQDHSPTVSLQVQVQNLRDVDDVALSGIEIKQVSLLSDKWEIRSDLCFVPDGLLHPQESIYCVLVAALPSGGKVTQSIVLQENRGPPANFDVEPYSSLVKRLRKTSEDLLFVLTWAATQASEDGCGPVLVHGQHYLLKSIQETASLTTQPGKEASYFVTYSMKFEPVIYHDFNKNKICIVPVVLYIHSCSDKEILVNYSANYDAGKSPKSTQVYMPEAASPLLWLGRVEGQLVIKHTSEPIQLSVAITRPGVYSLAQGMQVDARTTEDGVKVTSPKLEFTLIVNQNDV